MSFDGYVVAGQSRPTSCGTSVTDMFAAGDAQVTHVYNEPGDYIVTLRIINLAGDDTATMIIKITAPEATPTPTPDGHADAHADAQPDAGDVRVPAQHHREEPDSTPRMTLSAAGWTYIIYGDLETGTKNKIQAQSPDHTLCRMKSTTTVIAHYRPGV